MARGRKAPKYLTHDQDKALVLEALSGSPKAYNDLAQKYKPILYIAVRRRLPHIQEEEAEDIVMSVMGRCFVSFHLYDPEKSKLFTWMIACVHNHMNGLNQGKKRIRGVEYGESGYDIDGIEDPSDFQVDVDRVNVVRLVRMLVDKLPPECAQAIKLKYFREMSNEEIAQEMGIKPTDVWYRVKKGREILKRLSDGHGLF